MGSGFGAFLPRPSQERGVGERISKHVAVIEKSRSPALYKKIFFFHASLKISQFAGKVFLISLVEQSAIGSTIHFRYLVASLHGSTNA